jgi:glycosyltransferase involved in cell wall biosynthesis
MTKDRADQNGARILFVTRKWAPAMGGMETYCHRLTEELAKTHQLDIVALPGRPDGRPPSAASLLTFPVIVLRRWLALQRAPDVLHIADMAVWPIGLLAGKRTKVVLSAHGTDVSYPRRGGFKGWLYGAYLRLGSKLIRRAEVIANSAATEAAVRENGWQKTNIVPLATDIIRPAPTKPPRRTILFAGRLVKLKGLAWFVDNVLDHLPHDITLEVAGTRWDPAQDAALNHPRVCYLGRLGPEALADAYATSLCVVLPNLELPNGEFEGFGLIACEAAAAGGVVLAANCGGLPEAVRDGETGFLVAPGNADLWQDIIAGVAAWSADYRLKFTGNAAETARAHFSWQRVAEDVQETYRKP